MAFSTASKFFAIGIQVPIKDAVVALVWFLSFAEYTYPLKGVFLVRKLMHPRGYTQRIYIPHRNISGDSLPPMTTH